jgi:hypothetical protein
MDIFERTDEEFNAAEKAIYTDRAADRLVEKLKTLDGMRKMMMFHAYQEAEDLRFIEIIPFVFDEDLEVIEKLIENDISKFAVLVNEVFEKVEKIRSKVEETPTAPEKKSWIAKLFATLKKLTTKEN